LVHARALLVSTREGSTAYIDADVRDPEKILAGAAKTLDFTRPIALMLLGIMGNVADLDEAYAIVRHLVSALPSGSYLMVSDGTSKAGAEVQQLYDAGGYGYHLRDLEEIARYFDGLELLEPGVVSVSRWRPDLRDGQLPVVVDQSGGVAYKP